MDKKYLVLIGAGAVVGLALVVALKKAAESLTESAGDALQAINPMNNDNVINQGVTGAYQGVTGSKGNIGTDLYEWLHYSRPRVDAPVYVPKPIPGVEDIGLLM